MSTTLKAAPLFVAVKSAVMRGAEHVATACSKTMATFYAFITPSRSVRYVPGSYPVIPPYSALQTNTAALENNAKNLNAAVNPPPTPAPAA